jgi:hypothetical protein
MCPRQAQVVLISVQDRNGIGKQSKLDERVITPTTRQYGSVSHSQLPV